MVWACFTTYEGSLCTTSLWTICTTHVRGLPLYHYARDHLYDDAGTHSLTCTRGVVYIDLAFLCTSHVRVTY